MILIFGTETYYHQRLLRAIRRRVVDPAWEAFSYSYFEHAGATAGAVRGAVLTPTMMAGSRLVVVRDPDELVGSRRTAAGASTTGDDRSSSDSDDGEADPGDGETGVSGDGTGGSGASRAESARQWAALLGEVPDDCNLVVSLSRDLAASSPLLKAAAQLEPMADAIRCLPATPKSAEVWVRKLVADEGGDIEPTASQSLVLRSGADLSVLEREVEKLVAYAGPGRKITDADVLVAATPSAEASVFDLVDLIGNRRTYEAVVKLRRLLEQGEPALRLMAMVVRQVRLVFLTRELVEAKTPLRDIEARLKLPTWVVRGYLAQARNFTREQLLAMMRALSAMDLEIKTGRREAAAALELFILQAHAGPSDQGEA